MVAVLVAVTDGLEDLSIGRLGAETLYSMRVALAVLVTTAAVAVLRWSVYRSDRDAVDTTSRRFPARITLVGSADPDIVAARKVATDSTIVAAQHNHAVMRLSARSSGAGGSPRRP